MKPFVASVNIPAFLVVASTTGFFGLLGLLFFKAFPPESKEILNIMLGSVGTAWTGIVSYYFGSSQGSARKTDMMAQSSTATTTDLQDGTVKTVTSPTPPIEPKEP